MALSKIVKQTIDQLVDQSDTDRQDSQEKCLSMYLDDYSSEIIKLLKSQFHKENYNRLYPMYANYYNLLKKIINLKSVIYKREAVRTWLKPKDKEDEQYIELINNSNIHRIMQTVNKITNVNNTSFVRIIPYQDKIQYEAVPSENISIIQDSLNPNEIIALLHRVTIKSSNLNLLSSATIPENIKSRDTSIIKYFYWDKENYIVLDNEMKPIEEFILPNPYIDKNINETIIPYIRFANFEIVAGDLWNETSGQDLYNGTLQVNVFQTYMNNLLKMAGYRQLYFTGIDNEEVKKLSNRVSDALQPIALSGENAKAGQFELTSNIMDVQSVIHDVISEIADNHGVEFSSRSSSAQKSSGLALQISHEAINNVREEQQPFYRESEDELAKKTVIVANTALKSNIDIKGKFSINFHEDKLEYALKDKIEWYKFLLSKNLKSVIDIYKEIDPDCDSDKEAENRIELNKKQNEELKADSFPLIPVEDDNDEIEN